MAAQCIGRVPGYTAGDHASYKQLNKWKNMHENSFFNNQRIITVKDLQASLSQYCPGSLARCSVGPRAHPQRPARQRAPRQYTNQAHHTSLVRHHFRDTPCTSDSRHSVHVISDTEDEEDDAPAPKMTNIVRLARMVKQARDKFKASIKVTPVLLRKPLTPSCMKQAQSYLVKDDKLDRMRSSSFTTVQPDHNPWDPNSYYNTHFPILLQKIPHRANVMEDPDFEDWYHPMVNTPGVSMSYFDRLPLGRITSAEINLHECMMN